MFNFISQFLRGFGVKWENQPNPVATPTSVTSSKSTSSANPTSSRPAGVGDVPSTIQSSSSTNQPTPIPITEQKQLKINLFKVAINYFLHPKKTILKHPIKAFGFNVAIKIGLYFIASIVPPVGWILFGFSIFFEKFLVSNFNKFWQNSKNSCSKTWTNIKEKFKSEKKQDSSNTASSSSDTSATSPSAVPSPDTSATPPSAAQRSATSITPTPATPTINLPPLSSGQAYIQDPNDPGKFVIINVSSTSS